MKDFFNKLKARLGTFISEEYKIKIINLVLPYLSIMYLASLCFCLVFLVVFPVYVLLFHSVIQALLLIYVCWPLVFALIAL